MPGGEIGVPLLPSPLMEAIRIVYETARKESHNALKIVGMSGHSRTTGHTREARMTEDRDRKKTAIVATAVRLFTERGGFHGTPPTSLIAREAGISNGTLFHYFPTKEELINFAYFDIEVVPKPLCREGDTRSHLAVLKLPPVAPPPRTLHRVAIPDGKPFHPPLARDIVQRGETSEVSVPIRECGTFRIFSG